MDEGSRWYALRVFYNRYAAIEATLSRDGVQSYIPMRTELCTLSSGRVVEKRKPLVAMLMFMKCSEMYIIQFRRVLYEKAAVYLRPGTDIPTVIPDDEMEQFIRLTTGKTHLFEPHPYNANLFTKAPQRYCVVEGELYGIEGYYHRISGERRFIVPVSNLLMLVSAYHIPQRYLQCI